MSLFKEIGYNSKEFNIFKNILVEKFKKEPEDFGILEKSNHIVLGKFYKDELRSFAIFQLYKDPTLHLGSMVDHNYFKNLNTIQEVGIYNIGLIYENENKLDKASKELITHFEKILLKRYEGFILLISLFKNANKLAFPLYKSLGFKQKKGRSYYMDIDPLEFINKYGRFQQIENIILKSFNEMNEKELVSLSKCYAEVFTSSIDVPIVEYLKQIISKPSFSKELSTIICDLSQDGEIVGFCFIEEGDDDTIYINAAGLNKDFRGKDISIKTLQLIMENSLKMGYKKVTLVTSSPKLKDAFTKKFCAKIEDTLIWFVKTGSK